MSEGSPRPVIPELAKLADAIFFSEHPDRKLRIRPPCFDEYMDEFRQFGMHTLNRRRVIVARITPNQTRRHNIDFMRVPFLLFADETVEDTDEVLAPILEEIMRDAAAGYGMKRR